MPRAGRNAVVVALTSAVVFFVAGAMTATAVPAAISWVTRAAPVAELAQPAEPLVVPTSPEQWFHAGGRNQGTEDLAGYLATLGLRDNPGLAITDGWGRTSGGDTSDHHISREDSWAYDLAIPGVNVPTEATDTAARRIASALGHPGWTEGNLVVNVNGYRFQLLWRVAGHFNHVHVGVRKTG